MSLPPRSPCWTGWARLRSAGIRAEPGPDRAALLVYKRGASLPIWVFVGYGGASFSWDSGQRCHPVTDIDGAAKALAAYCAVRNRRYQRDEASPDVDTRRRAQPCQRRDPSRRRAEPGCEPTPGLPEDRRSASDAHRHRRACHWLARAIRGHPCAGSASRAIRCAGH